MLTAENETGVANITFIDFNASSGNIFGRPLVGSCVGLFRLLAVGRFVLRWCVLDRGSGLCSRRLPGAIGSRLLLGCGWLRRCRRGGRALSDRHGYAEQ